MANEKRYGSTCSDWSVRSYLGQVRKAYRKVGSKDCDRYYSENSTAWLS